MGGGLCGQRQAPPPAAKATLRVVLWAVLFFCRIIRHKDTWLDPSNLDNGMDTASRSPAL